ncbi:MAG: VOC family protein [Candidatus Binataceae bacterium]|nr:VOC family protein [Candidatus Binataceae bacterium]
MIHPERLGHVVIKVRDLERSKKFYIEVLGMDLMEEVPQFRIAFLAFNRRDHHEIGLLEVGPEADPGKFEQVGLLHIAFRMKTYEELRAAYQELKSREVKVVATVDHGVARGVYFKDPDGNELELYVDGDPAVFGKWPNAYAGVEKLDFAQDSPGLMESVLPPDTH